MDVENLKATTYDLIAKRAEMQKEIQALSELISRNAAQIVSLQREVANTDRREDPGPRSP